MKTNQSTLNFISKYVLRSPGAILTASFFLAVSSLRAEQPVADPSVATPAAAVPASPSAATLTDAQLAKALTDLGATVKTEGNTPDGAIVEITFFYTHTARPTPTGAMAPPYLLTDDLLARISKLPKLTHLELNMCTSLTVAGLANLKEMTQLQALALPYPIVNDTVMSYLSGLTNLTYFRASAATRVTVSGWAVIQNWKKLETLWVAEGSFNDATMPYLKGLTQLKDLTFYGDSVTDTGAEVLLGLPNLTSVRLGPRMSKAGTVKLQAALPNCRFWR